jgi:ferritin-like protein
MSAKRFFRKEDPMALRTKWLDWWRKLPGSRSAARVAVLDLLNHRYVREKQHAMRYRQHAERMRHPQFRNALLGIAAEEEKHAESIGAKIKDWGEKLPNVIPIYVAKEANSWFYLRTDLDEEQRCVGELKDAMPLLRSEFSEIAVLLEKIDNDSKRHRAQLREMLARTDSHAMETA